MGNKNSCSYLLHKEREQDNRTGQAGVGDKWGSRLS